MLWERRMWLPSEWLKQNALKTERTNFLKWRKWFPVRKFNCCSNRTFKIHLPHQRFNDSCRYTAAVVTQWKDPNKEYVRGYKVTISSNTPLVQYVLKTHYIWLYGIKYHLNVTSRYSRQWPFFLERVRLDIVSDKFEHSKVIATLGLMIIWCCQWRKCSISKKNYHREDFPQEKLNWKFEKCGDHLLERGSNQHIHICDISKDVSVVGVLCCWKLVKMTISGRSGSGRTWAWKVWAYSGVRLVCSVLFVNAWHI